MVELPTRIITFKADEDLIKKLDYLAKKIGSTRSDIIRMAIMAYLKELDNRSKERNNGGNEVRRVLALIRFRRSK